MMQLSKEPSSALSGTFSHLQEQTGEGPFCCLLLCVFAWEKVPDRADEGSF